LFYSLYDKKFLLNSSPVEQHFVCQTDREWREAI
jgi:hypothetical protein